MEMFTEDNIKQVNVNYELGAGLDFKREDFDFEYVTSRKAQAAAKKAQKRIGEIVITILTALLTTIGAHAAIC